MADVTVENHGTLFSFTLHTQAALDWYESNVDIPDWETTGGSFRIVEHRYARDIAQGLLDAGLEVE